MSLFWQSFLGTAGALGLTGVLAYLFRTSIEHWLAKSLAEHAANLETRETGKRAAIERLDRERAEFVGALMRQLVDYEHKRATAPHIADGAEPIAVYFDRWMDLSKLHADMRLFIRAREHLQDRAFMLAVANWDQETHSDLMTFMDDVGQANNDQYWQGQRDVRTGAMYQTFRQMIERPLPALAELKRAFRAYSGVVA